MQKLQFKKEEDFTGNPYYDELKKFYKKEVTIKDQMGEEFKGVIDGINFSHLNIILHTDKEKIIIKNPTIIRRTRTFTKT